jgi:hypothetical protein
MRFFKLLTLFSMLAFSVKGSGLTTPSISANSLFLYQNSNFHSYNFNTTTPDQSPNGLDLQEAELQIYSDVDPYTRLNLLLSISPTYTSNGTTVSETWGLTPEEVFAESNVVQDVTFKVGKFYAALGKHNMLHTHAFPFIEAPLANTKLLGDGLNDAGGSAAILVPTRWYDEITVQYLRGQNSNAEFSSPSPGGGLGLVHWKNLFDLSDDLTMEAGASYVSGGNSYGSTTTLTGADLTFKWRPSQGGLYKSVAWTSEYLGRTQSQASQPNEQAGGLASWVQYQFAERWAALYRYDNLGVKNSYTITSLPNVNLERHSIAMSFSPSEFSSYKTEIFQTSGGSPNTSNQYNEYAFFLQANFTIGAHPAHAY